MKRGRKKTPKGYYIALNKANNSIHIASTKLSIAEFLDIHVITVTRQLINCSMYANEKYIIWSDVRVSKINRGFRLTH